MFGNSQFKSDQLKYTKVIMKNDDDDLIAEVKFYN